MAVADTAVLVLQEASTVIAHESSSVLCGRMTTISDTNLIDDIDRLKSKQPTPDSV